MATNTTDTRLVVIVLALLGALVLLPTLFMGFGMMGAGPMGMGHDGMWGSGGSTPGWWPVAGLLMQVLFLAAVVGLGYLLYRAVVGAQSSTAGGDPALEELRLAYARGDLDEEEYERRREHLQREE
jgi:putative membrane protein